MLAQLTKTFLPRSQAATNQTLGHPSAGVVGWFESSTNSAGVAVNEATALTFSAVWCANRVIAETLACLPCILYRKVSDTDRQRATDDERHFLVHDEPHPSLTPVTFFETQTSHVVMSGNCYARIVRDQRGMPVRLEPKLPGMIRVDVDGEAITYTDQADDTEIPQADMLHVLGLGGDGVQGWSVVKMAANSIGGGLAGETRANSQYRNGAMPTGALSHPMRMTKDARESLRREWEEIHGGAEKAGRIAILHGGMDFKPFSMSNEDAQFLQSRKFSIEEIARWFRVPLHMLAHLENSSVRANIEQQALEFLVYSMGPWLTRWQQALNRKLLSREERQTLYFEFLLDALLRGDISSRYTAYSTARQWGWLSVNDIRRAENMNAIPDGDIYLQPANMVPAGTEPGSVSGDLRQNLVASLAAIMEHGKELKTDIATGHNSVMDVVALTNTTLNSALEDLRRERVEIQKALSEPPADYVRGAEIGEELAEAALTIFRECLVCCVKIEKAEAVKAARRQQEHGESFLTWLDEFYSQYQATMLERTHRAVACWERATGGMEDDWAADWCTTSREQLLAAADGEPDGFVSRVQATIDNWDERLSTFTPGDL